MAYKFQTLAATMSGSLTQEGDFTVKNDAGVTGFSATAAGIVSGSGALSAGGNLQTAGTVKLTGVADAAVAVVADSMYFLDADGLVKSERLTDYATAIAGPGLGAVDGVLEVDIDEFSALGGTGLHQTQDHFLFSDNGTEKKITFSNLQDAVFADVSGDATIAAGGALTIAATSVNGSMLNTDAISGQTNMTGDVDDTDEMMISDAGTLKRIDFSVFRDAVFNDLSGDATVAAGGAITIAATAVEGSMLNTDVISGQTELAQGSLAAADEIMISDGGTLKKFGVDSLAKDALALTTEAAIANGDYIMFLDGGATGETKKEALADVATLFAGDGLVAASSVLAVQVSGAVHVSSDKVALSGSVAGTGLTYTGGVDSIATLALDIDELAALGGTGVAQGDHFVFSDGGTEKKITASNLEDWIFGNVSGDATIAAGGALTIAANAVQTGMVHDDVATELAGGGLSAASGVMALDLNELSAASVDVANDVIAIVDANDSNASKKESIANLMTAVAGAGLTATNGVLAVDSAVAPVARGDANVTLSEGFNYGSTNLTSARTWTLPAPAEAGDIVHVKAPANCSTTLTITIDGGTIDGDSSIVLESPHAAVSLICFDQGNDLWKLF